MLSRVNIGPFRARHGRVLARSLPALGWTLGLWCLAAGYLRARVSGRLTGLALAQEEPSAAVASLPDALLVSLAFATSGILVAGAIYAWG